LPVAGFSPNTNNNTAAITDMSKNGMDTTIHEMMPNPARHKTLSKYTNKMVIQTWTNAML
jgi:hypothetical protein